MKKELVLPTKFNEINSEKQASIVGGKSISWSDLNPFNDPYFMKGFKTGLKIGIRKDLAKHTSVNRKSEKNCPSVFPLIKEDRGAISFFYILLYTERMSI